MAKELTGWDKLGAVIRKRAALSSYGSGYKPLGSTLLARLGTATRGKKPPTHKDWIGDRPDLKDLAGTQF